MITEPVRWLKYVQRYVYGESGVMIDPGAKSSFSREYMA